MGLKIDGVGFNRAWLESFTSEAAFLSTMNDPGQAHVFAGANRTEKLQMVWALVHPPAIAPAATKRAKRKTKKVGIPEEPSLAGGKTEG